MGVLIPESKLVRGTYGALYVATKMLPKVSSYKSLTAEDKSHILMDELHRMYLFAILFGNERLF